MNVLRKTVTLKINLFVLLLVLLFLGAVVAGVYFRAPQNLFFMLLSPAQVESVQIRVSSREYQELSSKETGELIAVLKDFRINDSGERCITPDSQARANYHIHMKWGLTLYLRCGDGGVSINANRYADHGDVSDRLYTLNRQQRQARNGQ